MIDLLTAAVALGALLAAVVFIWRERCRCSACKLGRQHGGER